MLVDHVAPQFLGGSGPFRPQAGHGDEQGIDDCKMGDSAGHRRNSEFRFGSPRQQGVVNRLGQR